MPTSPQPLTLTPAVPAAADVLAVPDAGAEPLDSVLRTLRLERLGEDEYQGVSLPQMNGRIYGGQVLAQSIVAAADTLVDDGDGPRALHSVHGYFLRPGKLDLPITFAVERLHDGRSFSTRRTHALQQGRPILSLISSYQEDQPGLDHGDAAPEVPAPETLTSAIELFDAVDHPVAKFMSSIAAFDIRHVGEPVYLQAPAERADTQMLWMRARTPLPGTVTQLQHRALLAYACDQVMLEPVLRRHGLSWRTRGHERGEPGPLDVVAPAAARGRLAAVRPALPHRAGRPRARHRRGVRPGRGARGHHRPGGHGPGARGRRARRDRGRAAGRGVEAAVAALTPSRPPAISDGVRPAGSGAQTGPMRTVVGVRLRRSYPDRPGYGRRRSGKGFTYLDRDGNRLADPEAIARCRSLVIPPAWRDVWICPFPNGHIQAVGTDDAGRRQYLYHPAWRATRDVAKHERVLDLAERLPAARRLVTMDLRKPGMPGSGPWRSRSACSTSASSGWAGRATPTRTAATGWPRCSSGTCSSGATAA